MPWRASQQPGLEGKQVGDEQGVLRQPPIERRVCNRAVAYCIEKRMPGSGGPEGIEHAMNNSGGLAERSRGERSDGGKGLGASEATGGKVSGRAKRRGKGLGPASTGD